LKVWKRKKKKKKKKRKKRASNHSLVPPDVAADVHVNFIRSVLVDQNMLDSGAVAVREGMIQSLFKVDELLAPEAVTGGDDELTLGIFNPAPKRFGAEAPKDNAVHEAQSSAGQHREHRLRDVGHVDGHPVTLLQPQRLEKVGHAGHLTQEFGVRDVPNHTGFVTFVNNGDLK